MNSYAIYIELYQLVYPIGINIFPISYSLFPHGPGPAPPHVRAPGGRPSEGPLRKSPAHGAGPGAAHEGIGNS